MKRKNIIVFILLISGVFTSVFAQDKGNETAADNTLRGSGRVNASTLGMEFSLPLGAYPGRGINTPINLSYSSKLWRMDYDGNKPVPGGGYSPCFKHYQPKFSENSASGWTTSLAVPYIEYLGAKNSYNYDGTPVSYGDAECPISDGGGGSYPYFVIRRLVIHLPSGETHELRADDTATGFTIGTSPPASFWNGTYYAADGSNIKYVQNSGNNTYRVLMPDGSFYDFDGTNAGASDRKAVTFTDRNGNFTSYNNTNGTWTDTLGRTLSDPIGASAPASPTVKTYTLPGMTGTYKFNWKKLKDGTAETSGLTDFSQNLKYYADTYVCNNGAGNPSYCSRPANTFLFGSDYDARIVNSQVFNPVVLAEIELPTGQKYKFSYDVYGRIEKITYPTGGVEVFQYGVVATLSMLDPSDYAGAQSNFGVVNRKVYKTANDTAPYEWTYQADYVTQTEGYKVTINNPDETRSERYLHRGYDAGTPFGKFGYDNALAGMAYEQRSYDSSNPKKLISKKLTTWTKTTLSTGGSGTPSITHWHPRVTQEETIIYDGTGSGVSATMKFEYEDEANLNLRETPLLNKKSLQYGFVAAGSALPSTPIRTTETTFLINDTNILQTTRDIYKMQNMIGLVSYSVIKDGAGTVVARSEMKYDDGSSSPNIGRGNPTSLRVWDNTKGNYDNPNAYITTYAKFDQWGNQYETTDAKGNTTSTVYDSIYHAYPIQVTSAVPDSTNTNGSNTAFVTTATYDTVTGLPLTTTDANGLESRIEYDPATLRPLRTKTYFNNSQVGSEAETIYHDETGNYWVKNRAQIDVNKWAESITYFDGLGRAYKAEEINSEGNIFVEKEFDAEGRVKRVTNPFRANETKQWTTNVYDNASRIKEVHLPDGAKVKTDYGVATIGNQIGETETITDEAGKKIRSITDVFDEVIRVDEPDDNGNLGTIDNPLQPTYYNYDTLGEMIKVKQGLQERFFMYDSLGRLLRVRQPEQNVNQSLNTTGNPENNQWTVGFTYDDNENILTSTNAEGVIISYTYDNLDRLVTRTYSDGTPQVIHKYDNLPNGKGKLIEVGNSISTSKTNAFDNLGRPSIYQQITDGEIYTSSYQYNLVGVLISEIYPSGKQVGYDYNTDGDLTRIWGQIGTNQKTYANSFGYSASGSVERLKLGNGRWETIQVNNRLQPVQLGLGSSSTDTSLWKVNYEYGEIETNGTVNTTKNSGNIAKQILFVSGMANPIVQTFKYDSLDRLTETEETSNGQQTWKQIFGYDRYGNRTGFYQQIGQLTNNQTPTVDPNTNRFTTGQGYIYDLNGNLIQDAEGRQFIFNGDNKQTQVKDVNNNTIGTYFYDGEGKRVKKVTNLETTIFVYSAGKLVAEYSTQLSQNPTTSYLTVDHLGSPRVITDAYGQVVSRRDFMPFGENLFSGIGGRSESLKYSLTGDNIRQKFTGYQNDKETGLDFAEARYYNSSHGRFTAVDPLLASGKSANPQSFNRYAYVTNSPTKLVDPSGMISENAGSPCGNRCKNSDGGVDGSAFRGRDASMDSLELGVPDKLSQERVDVQGVLDSYAPMWEKISEWQETRGKPLNRVSNCCRKPVQRGRRGPVRGRSWRDGLVTVGGQWTVGRRQPRRQPRHPRRNPPDPWIVGRDFPNLRDHWRGHAPNGWSQAIYLQSARNHIQRGGYGFRQMFNHNGQSKWGYVTRTGPDSFIFTSTSRDGRTIFTHMIQGRDGKPINGQYLRNLGIQVTSYPENFIGPIGGNQGRNE